VEAEDKAQLILDAEKREARIVFLAALDIAIVETAERLLREAAEANVRRLELDFANVPFADTTVVRLAMKAREHVVRSGAEVVVVKAPPPIRRLFDLTKTADHFEIVAA
jgi:anti-anti-sigma factor